MDYEIYTVVEGDNIINIAEKFGTRVIDIIEENNLEDTYYLTPGQQLRIPQKKTGFAYYTVKKGDNSYQIAKSYNIDLDTLTKLNGLESGEYIYPDQHLLVPEEGVKTYITKMGDTLDNLAEKLGINRDDILFFNESIYLLPEQLIAYRTNNVS